VTSRYEQALFLYECFFDLFFRFVFDGWKIEQHVCNKFCVKLGKSAIETLEMLHEAFGEHPLSRTTVFKCYSRFKASRVSVEDAELSE
jgi:hypothetical protein